MISDWNLLVWEDRVGNFRGETRVWLRDLHHAQQEAKSVTVSVAVIHGHPNVDPCGLGGGVE